MSVRNYSEVIQIIDATTGEIKTQIRCRLFKEETIRKMIEDIFLEDYQENKKGILIKYGIEP